MKGHCSLANFVYLSVKTSRRSLVLQFLLTFSFLWLSRNKIPDIPGIFRKNILNIPESGYSCKFEVTNGVK
jgi:hypothetical protein